MRLKLDFSTAGEVLHKAQVVASFDNSLREDVLLNARGTGELCHLSLSLLHVRLAQ